MRGYIATFHDVSYGSLGGLEENGEYLPTIGAAMNALHNRYHNGRDAVTRPTWDEYGRITGDVNTWKCGDFDFPAVTDQATIDLFPIDSSDYGNFAGDSPAIRLSIGPRGGIRRENY